MATGDEIVEKVSEWKQKFGLAHKEEIPHHQRSLAKGMLAGLVGGVVATAAKTFGESLFPPRTHGEPEPQVPLTAALLSISQRQPKRRARASAWHSPR